MVMPFARWIKHLCYGDWRVRRAFPDSALHSIERAIHEAEKTHSGEIRFAVEGGLDIGPLLRGMTARERAVEVFSELRVWDTEQNSGVLIYLLLADRDVEIIADRGIHARAGQESWECICRDMEVEFRAGRFETGVTAGIRSVAAHLQKHYPARGDDINELADRPVVL
ncbi:MAG: TPM domain-containing protein [Gammaproteobacteria bacterium]|nr:TPM domain-containing protein [Gammaproteobacteria bacterium]